MLLFGICSKELTSYSYLLSHVHCSSIYNSLLIILQPTNEKLKWEIYIMEYYPVVKEKQKRYRFKSNSLEPGTSRLISGINKGSIFLSCSFCLLPFLNAYNTTSKTSCSKQQHFQKDVPIIVWTQKIHLTNLKYSRNKNCWLLVTRVLQPSAITLTSLYGCSLKLTVMFR